MATKKQIKDLKKRIVKETAVEVGYVGDVVHKLPTYAIINAIKTISSGGLIKANTSDAEAESILVTEAVKETNYSDFKDFAPHFITDIFKKD